MRSTEFLLIRGSREGFCMAGNDMAWTRGGVTRSFREIDITKPSVARVYDAILGGKDNFAVDREVAEMAMAAVGDGGAAARLNRDALGRAVRFMAGQGIVQFLDLGSGLPTAQNTHQIGKSVNPDARVVYVDNDPIAYMHGQALLIDDDTTTVVLADIREPDALLAMPEVNGFLDFSQPVGLILNAVIHHILDEEDPAGIVSRCREALAPDSYMLLTHFCSDSEEARELEQVLQKGLGRGKIRSREQIERFFDGLELVEPGLVYLPQWRPDESAGLPLERSTLCLVGVGRKS
jgi:hypothetical protein